MRLLRMPLPQGEEVNKPFISVSCEVDLHDQCPGEWTLVECACTCHQGKETD